MELPERLQDRGDPADNEEEVLQPQYQGGMFMNMNQSIFGMLAAAGSQVDFSDRFEGGQSSDEDDDSEAAMAMTIAGHRPAPPRRGPADGVGAGSLAQTTILRKPASVVKSEGRHRRKLSETRLISGLKRLSSKSRGAKSPKGKGVAGNQLREDQEEDAASGSRSVPLVPPSIEVVRSEASRHAPVMSRMLEARAEMAARPSFDLDRMSSEQGRAAETGEAGPSELAKRLKEIFEFEQPEEVIEGMSLARLAAITA
jgi:sterol 3beta-glucosyltransferase